MGKEGGDEDGKGRGCKCPIFFRAWYKMTPRKLLQEQERVEQWGWGDQSEFGCQCRGWKEETMGIVVKRGDEHYSMGREANVRNGGKSQLSFPDKE